MRALALRIGIVAACAGLFGCGDDDGPEGEYDPCEEICLSECCSGPSECDSECQSSCLSNCRVEIELRAPADGGRGGPIQR